MVRPDETGRGSRSPESASRRIDPAGESPAQVIAGEPGSRPPAPREIPVAEARCRKPRVRKLPRGQRSGLQRVVNAEQASSDRQPKGVWGSHPAHVTAMAMHTAQVPDRAVGPSGVLAAAHSDGSMRNRRDPTRQPTSGDATRIRSTTENAECREGVRGVRSTDEGGEKPLEGRGPASVKQAHRRTRAWS